MADFGYDVADYCDVDPLFGDLDDFDRLLAACHARGLKLIVDLVPNHTSDQHPWFRAARSSRDDPQRDWYVWRDGTPDDGPPNNWVAAFTGGPAWTWDEATGQWYLHLFLPEQPDLNWANPEVVEADARGMRFWLDRGVDGFRIDVVHCIGKDPACPTTRPRARACPTRALNDTAETHELLRGMRKLVDAYPGDRLILGEVYLLVDRAGGRATTATATSCTWRSTSRRCSRRGTPAAGAARSTTPTHRIVDRCHGWPTWVLSNHDNLRHRTRYGGSEARARAAAVPAARAARAHRSSTPARSWAWRTPSSPRNGAWIPGGRDGCRAPIPWDGGRRPRLGRRGAWLPWPPEADARNVAALRDDTGVDPPPLPPAAGCPARHARRCRPGRSSAWSPRRACAGRRGVAPLGRRRRRGRRRQHGRGTP